MPASVRLESQRAMGNAPATPSTLVTERRQLVLAIKGILPRRPAYNPVYRLAGSLISFVYLSMWSDDRYEDIRGSRGEWNRMHSDELQSVLAESLLGPLL